MLSSIAIYTHQCTYFWTLREGMEKKSGCLLGFRMHIRIFWTLNIEGTNLYKAVRLSLVPSLSLSLMDKRNVIFFSSSCFFLLLLLSGIDKQESIRNIILKKHSHNFSKNKIWDFSLNMFIHSKEQPK